MRRRLKNFLPIVLIALTVQIFAPIAACWAAGAAASDPFAAAICHGNGGTAASQGDATGGQGTQHGCCSLCGVLHTGAPVEPPPIAALFSFERHAATVVWHELSLAPAVSRAGSPEQARAPPALS